MAFDFESVVERRGTDSSKWGARVPAGTLPMPVADMDFPSPPCVRAALRRRLEHGVFGYAEPYAALEQAVVDWLATHYGWSIQPDWLVWTPGVVTGLNIVSRLAVPERGVLVSPPVYPPFLSAPDNTGRVMHRVDLLDTGRGGKLDEAGLDRAAAAADVLFLCNPHNPTGHVCREAELRALAAIAARRELIVCADEIHCDLILEPGLRHIPFATLSPDAAARSITFMSPSKTFNLAGLMCAYAIIPDAKLRARFRRAARGIVTEINVFGLTACEAALREGEQWRQALLACLRANRDRLASVLSDCPGVSMEPAEATYLAWIDCRGLSGNPVERFARQGLALSDGQAFGAPRGFVRLNFGCPPALLEDGLVRFKAAVAAA